MTSGPAGPPGRDGNTAGSPTGAPEVTGTGVAGRVTTVDGAPVGMATLTAVPEPAGRGPVRQEANVSDADGWFFLPLPPGTWAVTVTPPRQEAVTVTVTVPDRGAASSDVVLPD